MTVKERVQAYCNQKNIAITYFERSAGLSNGYFKQTTKRVPAEKLERIHRAFPDLNPNWLNTEMGGMIIPSTPNTIVTGDINGNGNNVIAGNNNKVGDEIPAEIVEGIKEELKEEVKEEVKAEIVEAESIPMVSGEISATSGVDVKAYIEENEDELEYINPSQKVGHANHAEQLTDMAMAPSFLPGDFMFLKFLKDKSAIVDGKMYYFNTKNRSSMIRKVKVEGNCLRLIAENPTFGDIIMPKDDVIRVAKIVGMLRLTFGDYYAGIEAVRKQKDAQIDAIIEQQGKLIAEMAEFSKRENLFMQMLAEKK